MIQQTNINLNDCAAKIHEMSRYKGYWIDPDVDAKITECMFYLSAFSMAQLQGKKEDYSLFAEVYEKRKGAADDASKIEIENAFNSIVATGTNDLLALAFISLLDFAAYHKLGLCRSVHSTRISQLKLGIQLNYAIRNENRQNYQKRISGILMTIGIVNKYPPESEIKAKWQANLISLALAHISQIATALNIDLEKHVEWRMEYMRVMPHKERVK